MCPDPENPNCAAMPPGAPLGVGFRIESIFVILQKLCFGAWLGVLLALLFFGALLWAHGRDPFQRVWFKVRTKGFGRAECIAVLPKMAACPLPVVVYLHGAGGSLLQDGNELRQIAELGLAAVGIDYSQTNDAAFEAQFAELDRHLRKQKWADTNAVAWVGFSLGANRQLSFALKHPVLQPRLLVRLAGGWVAELEQFEHPESSIQHQAPSILLLHGDQDMVFPLSDARRVASALQTNGFPVELKVFPGQSHTFDPNRGVLFRESGAHCLRFFKGPRAFDSYESILSWQARAKPLWMFWIPAMLWAAAWGCTVWRRERLKGGMGKRKRTAWETGLRWAAGVLAAIALGQTALHLVTPQLAITPRTLAVARTHLVSPKAKSDFDFLAQNPVWSGKRLRTLLQHVELPNYNRELVNWKLEEQDYREFVLSPEIDPTFDGDMGWRRALWESFYPRIRKEGSPEATAEIVGRHLRERVTVVEGLGSTNCIAASWQRQVTDGRGFQALCVAALRSVGIPARLNSQGQAELRADGKWQLAPRPQLETW